MVDFMLLDDNELNGLSLSTNPYFENCSFFQNLSRHKKLEKKAWANNYDYRMNLYGNFEELTTITRESRLNSQRNTSTTKKLVSFHPDRLRRYNLYTLHKISKDLLNFSKVRRLIEKPNLVVTGNVLVRWWTSQSLFTLIEKDYAGRGITTLVF